MATGKTFCEPEGHIIDLFKILITSDIKEMAMLTNSQLIEILEKEFYMDTGALHTLELEIYLTVLKKYLKTWPEWDTIEQKVNKIKKRNDNEAITKILKEGYVRLKEYLQSLLDAAQVLAEDRVEELKRKEKKGKSNNYIAMELEATRQQLNTLFYRYPVEDSIFNMPNYIIQEQNDSTTLTFESIINWWGVEIEINLKNDNKYVTYRRRNPHRFKHTLVNKKLGLKTYNTELDQKTRMKLGNDCKKINKADFLDIFKPNTNLESNTNCRTVFYNILLRDLNSLPSIFDVPCTFRKYLSKHSYVRYLYQDTGGIGEIEKFDLQLEEIISPMSEFYVSFVIMPHANYDFKESITIICGECNLTFKSKNLVLTHFNDIHSKEADWRCTKCSKVFSAQFICHSGWIHKCSV